MNLMVRFYAKRSTLLPIAFCTIALAPGCKKKEDASAVPVSPTAAASPATAANGGAASLPPATDAAKYFAETDAALKAKEYDKAVQSLLTLQRQPLNDQQARAAHDRMIQVQSTLVGAVLSGDPRAKAAAEMLRRSSQP